MGEGLQLKRFPHPDRFGVASLVDALPIPVTERDTTTVGLRSPTGIQELLVIRMVNLGAFSRVPGDALKVSELKIGDTVADLLAGARVQLRPASFTPSFTSTGVPRSP